MKGRVRLAEANLMLLGGRSMTKCRILSLPLIFLSLCIAPVNAASATGNAHDLKIAKFLGPYSVEMVSNQKKTTLKVGERTGDWTLVEVINDATTKARPYAVLEDFVHQDGHIVFV